MAQQQISRAAGVLWIGFLATYAMVVAYYLNPIACALFAAAALLEYLYCKLARVTAWKFPVSGAMVGVGALAGWVALTTEVRPLEMALLFVWMFAWEIGGRNIVNDFADVEEDGRLGIRTVPLVYGPRLAARLAFWFLLLIFLTALALAPASQLSLAYLIGAILVGVYFLLWPGVRLLRSPTPPEALALFNRASLYPPAMVAVLILSFHLPL